MATEAVTLASADGEWTRRGANLPAFNRDDKRLSALMLGAGLSRAANPNSLLWGELIRRVGERLDTEIPERLDPLVAALSLSRRHARLPATAQASRLQQEVRNAIEESWRELRGIDAGLAEQLGKLVRGTACQVIIDLNYDRSAEMILEQQELPFYRIIGAQIDVQAPLPDDTILLWKIHGSMDFPSTIVLSPTEYQRIYETNHLGSHLMELGKQMKYLWTVGVGLTDDDVWTYLCSGASGLEVFSVRLSDSYELAAWRGVVEPRVARITVLAAARPTADDPSTHLRARLEDICELLQGGSKTGWSHGRLNERAKAACAEFDRRYGEALATKSPASVRAIVEEHRRDYDNLRHLLLTKTAAGSGYRWLPALSVDGVIDDRLRRALTADLLEVLDRTREYFDRYVSPPRDAGLLVASCAQFVVQYVLDLFDLFGIDDNMSHRWPDEPQVVPREERVLVGANPFELQLADEKRFNPFHFFRLADSLAIGAPLWSGEEAPNDGGEKPDAEPELLSEDQWEAAVVWLYRKSRPTIRFGTEEVDLEWVPPIFPWGFRLGNLRTYREQSRGSISKAWHLVSTQSEIGRQVCKGGSLRDHSPRAFTIAGRGSIRVGEYDDFVQQAAI